MLVEHRSVIGFVLTTVSRAPSNRLARAGFRRVQFALLLRFRHRARAFRRARFPVSKEDVGVDVGANRLVSVVVGVV